jgi:hypothetical protein
VASGRAISGDTSGEDVAPAASSADLVDHAAAQRLNPKILLDWDPVTPINECAVNNLAVCDRSITKDAQDRSGEAISHHGGG